MKILQISGLALWSLLLISACAEDEAIIPSVEGPETSLMEGPGLVSSNDTILNGRTFAVKLSAKQGDSPLNDLRIQEGGVNIPSNRIVINSNAANANPILLTGSDKSNFTYDVEVTADDQAKVTEYTFVVTDENSRTASSKVTITTLGTAVDTLMGVLFNAGGKAGTGGLDLDQGIGVGSQDTTAEIRDEGIDLDLPASQNWRKQIAGANGAELRSLVPGQNGLAESFEFASISTKEVITELFDQNGVEFTMTNSAGDLVSDPIKVGDVIAVRRGVTTYLITVVEINETSDNNEDYYVLNIKY